MILPEVLIIYEHKVREYFYCKLLQSELEARNIKVRICHHDYLDTWKYKLFSYPKIVIAPCALSTEIFSGFTVMNRYSDFLRGRAPFYINLQAEQLFREDGKDYNFLDDSEYDASLYYICWGEYRKKQLLELGVKEDHIAVVGAIHLDFLRPELQELYFSKKEIAICYGIDPLKRWGLFISSYTYAGMLEQDKRWCKEVMTSVNNSYDEGLLEEKIRISNNSRTIMINWIERYLESCDDIYIYRIHPHERISKEMRELTERFPKRFLIVKEETLQQWILVSDYINIWISTAIIDVYLARKPCSIIWPVHPPEDIIPVTMDGVDIINSYEEFASRNRSVAFERFPIEESKLDNYYNILDKSPAYLHIADFVQELLKKKSPICGKSKFDLKRVFSKHFVLQIYLSFFAKYKISLSKFCGIYREKLKEQEDMILRDGDITFTNLEKDFCKRIHKKILGQRRK